MMTRPISVLHFTNGPTRGGAEEHILTLLRGLDRRYFQLHLVCAPEVADKIRPDVPSDVELIPLLLRKPLQLGAALRFINILRSRKIEILHSHLFYSSLFASPLGALAGVPVVLETPHVRELWRKGIKGNFAVDRLVARSLDAVIAVSHANAEYLIKCKRLPARKIHVIHNGCDIKRFSNAGDPSAFRAAQGIPATDPVIVVLARLEPQKGHSFLLNALPQVVAEFPRLRVLFVGDGALRADLEMRARELNLEGSVTFAGYQSNPMPWLSIADFTVLPSLYEGLPLVVIESLAAGKPVIATAVDGSPEVVVHEKTGLLVPPGDPQSLAAGVLTLLTDEGLRHRLGDAGKTFVLENFAQEQQVRRTEDLYFELLAAKTGRAVKRDAEQVDPVAAGENAAVLTA
jgi:glycosyltransferase involved in cell wall biosynthesis